MKPGRLIIILLALLLLSFLAFAIFRSKEPRYQGRTLTEWIESARWEHLSPYDSDEEVAAKRALKQMAPEAIPILLKWLQVKDTPLRLNLAGLVNGHPFLHMRIRYPEELNHDAVVGFELLGADAKPAWPSLIKLSEESNEQYRIYAMECLFETKLPKGNFWSPCCSV